VSKLLSPHLVHQSDADMPRLMGAHAPSAQHLRRADSSSHAPLHININVSQALGPGLHAALGQSGTPNSLLGGPSHWPAGTPYVGTPLTPLADGQQQVGTPSGLAEDQFELGSLSGSANCSWFDHLFGTGGASHGPDWSHPYHQHHHQLAAHQHGHAQIQVGQGVVGAAAAVQKQTLAVTFPAGGMHHKPHSSYYDESTPRLEDTTTSWAPDEFVFSPQGSDAEGGDEETEDTQHPQQPASKKAA